MNKVLVTGASGFLGFNCIEMLKSTDFEIHATDINLGVHQNNNKVHWHQADLADNNQVYQLIKKIKPTHLLHAAWNMETGIKLNSEIHLPWLEIGMNLVKTFAHFGGKRIVSIGSAMEYGPVTSRCIENETPLRPDSVYGKVKHKFQMKLDAFCKQNNLSYAWPRIFLMFGAHENPMRIVPYVIRSIQEKQLVEITQGNQILDYLYVNDVVNALNQLLEGHIEGAVNVCSGKPIQLKEIVLSIAGFLGGEQLLRFGARPSSPHDPKYLVGDNTLLKRETNWVQQYTIEEGLKKTIDSMC